MSAAAPLPITLMVIARNEAASIGRCLDSVPFVAEKIVVDSGSTDATVQVAAAHGARVVHQAWLGFGPQRNFATGLAAHDWILVLDADEELSAPLIAEFRTRVPEMLASDAAGAVLRRSTWYMGAPMRWYRPMTGERIARFYHRRRARWSDVRVHESLLFAGRVEHFKHPFVHHHNPTLVHKQFKMLRYAELKTRDWLSRERPQRLWLCPLVFIATFLKDYVLRLGFLDGGRGYVAAQIAAGYAVYRRLRYYEMTRNPTSVEAARTLLVRHDLEL